MLLVLVLLVLEGEGRRHAMQGQQLDRTHRRAVRMGNQHD